MRAGRIRAAGPRHRKVFARHGADVYFGQNLTHAAPGAELRVGDEFVARTSGGCAVC